MALTTFSELKTAIAGFLNRDDLTSVVGDFITLAEAQMNRDIRHWRMVERATATFSGRYTTLPDDWLETVRLTMGNVSQGYRALRLMSHDQMERERARDANTSGAPLYYAHLGAEIEVWPTPDESYTGELVYIEKIPALSDDQPTNWVLDHAPDAYLYASLLQSAPYLHEDERVAVWGNLYAGAVARLNATSDSAAASGTSLRMRMPR